MAHVQPTSPPAANDTPAFTGTRTKSDVVPSPPRTQATAVPSARGRTTDPLEIIYKARNLEQTPFGSLLQKGLPERYEACLHEQRNTREYAEKHLWPNVERWDQIAATDHGFVPWEAIDGALPYKILSANLAKTFGGRQIGILAGSMFAEEISAADAGVYVIFGSHGLTLSALGATLDMPLMARVSREIVAAERQGKALLLALAYTEPGGGSDVEDVDEIKRGNIASRFERVAGGYRLNARKVFISVGDIAHYVLVSAFEDPKRPLETAGQFLVRRDAPGFSVGRVEHKMGQRLCNAVEIICDDVFVQSSDAIVTDAAIRAAHPDFGARTIDTTLSLTRGPVGAMATGVMRGVFERTLRYLSHKRVKGHWLFEEQWVQLTLADMLAAIQAGRNLYMEAALAVDTWGLVGALTPSFKIPDAVQKSPVMQYLASQPGTSVNMRKSYAEKTSIEALQRVVAHASIAKFMCSDMAVRSCMKAMEILGEDANDPQWGVEKCMRDVKLAQIFEGTNEVNRLHVARGLLGHGA